MKKERGGSAAAWRRPTLGLTAKFVLLAVVPLIAISSLSVYFSDRKTHEFQERMLADGSELVNEISRSLVSQLSASVARQTRQYLFSHPDLKRDEFNTDIYFKKVCLQRVGETGSTALYERAGPGHGIRAWAHLRPTFVGAEVDHIEFLVGPGYERYREILSAVEDEQDSTGTYIASDEYGRQRERFMVCTAVEGTPYFIATSVDVDEFTEPLRALEEAGKTLSVQMRAANLAILGTGFALVGLAVLLYGRTLTGRIKRLSGAADRISMGHMEEVVPVEGADEVSELAEAIARLQHSVRLAMKRMARRG